MTTIRAKIVDDFAKWTALSALRSGAPIKAKQKIDKLLEQSADFRPLFDSSLGKISPEEFDQWHERTVHTFCEDEPGLKGQIGWAAKIINVYLKTRVYLAGEGREGLVAAIHPPIDNGLVRGLKRNFPKGAWEIQSIKGITSYQDHYIPFICQCGEVTQKKGWLLIEVEFYWQPLNSQPEITLETN